MLNRRLFFFILILGVVSAWWFAHQGAREDLAVAGSPVPDFTLSNDQGRKVSLSRLKGKVVLVHFWATWCHPCAEEIPLLDQLAKKMKGEKFELLAISVDEEGKKAVSAFRKKIPFSFPVLLDAEQKVVELFGTFTLPESFLINPEGIIIKKYRGPQRWDDPRMEKAILSLLKAQN